MAERMGTSVSTLIRLEKGDGSVSWTMIMAAMDILGFVSALENVTDSANDELGIGISDSKVPQRIRARTIKKETGAF